MLRAVGEPARRFDEDALRLLRAARLAAQLGFTIEPATRGAMTEHAGLVRHVSAERVGRELTRMLEASPPSSGFRILAETSLLGPLFPELAAQRGVPQDKIPGHDLWEHTLATLDAAAALAPDRLVPRLAALLHDVGKVREFTYGAEFGISEEGRLLGHLAIGAEIIGPAARELPEERRAQLLHCVLSHHGADGGRGAGRGFASAEALALYRLNALEAGVKGALEHGLNGHAGRQAA
jgi:putative nucleotidyltransferase with HDIG domain